MRNISVVMTAIEHIIKHYHLVTYCSKNSYYTATPEVILLQLTNQLEGNQRETDNFRPVIKKLKRETDNTH